MIENIRALSLQDKKTLLAMLQADLGLEVVTELVVKKPDYWTIESRRCNEIAIVKRGGGQVIYTDLQSID